MMGIVRYCQQIRDGILKRYLSHGITYHQHQYGRKKILNKLKNKLFIILIIFTIGLTGCAKTVTSLQVLKSYTKVRAFPNKKLYVITVTPYGNPMPIRKVVLSEDGKFLYMKLSQHKGVETCGGLKTLQHFTGVKEIFLPSGYTAGGGIGAAIFAVGTLGYAMTTRKQGLFIYDLSTNSPYYYAGASYVSFLDMLNNNMMVSSYGVYRVDFKNNKYDLIFRFSDLPEGCDWATGVIKTQYGDKVIVLNCSYQSGTFFKKVWSKFLFLDPNDMSVISSIETPKGSISSDIIPIPDSHEALIPILYSNEYVEIFLVDYMTGQTQPILSGFSQSKFIPIDIVTSERGRYIAIVSALVKDKRSYLKIFDLSSGEEIFTKELRKGYIAKIKSWGFYNDRLVIADEERIYIIDPNTEHETTILDIKSINIEKEDIGDVCLARILIDKPKGKAYIPLGANLLVMDLKLL